jgi:hypothetical protein
MGGLRQAARHAVSQNLEISESPLVGDFCSKLRAPRRGTSLGPFVCGANNKRSIPPETAKRECYGIERDGVFLNAEDRFYEDWVTS